MTDIIANEERTPRTRNRVFDETTPRPAPKGYTRGDWTVRKQVEADFRALGFRSHKFSHKKEPDTRFADSLWLSWNWDSKRQSVPVAAVCDIEVRVTFLKKEHSHYTDYETIATVTHEGYNGGCINRRIGKTVFDLCGYSDFRDIMEHVEYLMRKSIQR